MSSPFFMVRRRGRLPHRCPEKHANQKRQSSSIAINNAHRCSGTSLHVQTCGHYGVPLPPMPRTELQPLGLKHDKDRYRSDRLIENASWRLKDLRRIATRYDMLATNFPSGVALATALAFGL